MKRFLRIYYLWQGTRDVPQIKLSGQWLASLGFHQGQPLEVTFEDGRLILTPAAK